MNLVRQDILAALRNISELELDLRGSFRLKQRHHYVCASRQAAWPEKAVISPLLEAVLMDPEFGRGAGGYPIFVPCLRRKSVPTFVLSKSLPPRFCLSLNLFFLIQYTFFSALIKKNLSAHL